MILNIKIKIDMRIHPQKYTKEEFVDFLKRNNVNDTIINKFLKLPKTVKYGGNKYEIYINSTWYNIGKTYYNFELNYYSEEQIEFLFGSKVFGDVELSINNILYELTNAKLINAC